MLRKRWIHLALAAFLGGTAAARAQYQVSVPATSQPVIASTIPAGTPVVVTPKGMPVKPSEEIIIIGPDARPVSSGVMIAQAPAQGAPAQGVPAPAQPGAQGAPAQGGGQPPAVAAPAFGEGESTSEAAETEGGYGPTPIQDVKTLHNCLRKMCGKEPLPEKKPEKKDDCPADKKDDCPADKKDEKPACPADAKGCLPAEKPADKSACPAEGCDKKDAAAADGCEEKKCNLLIFGWADFDYTYRSIGGGNNPIAPVMNHFGNEFLNRQDGIAISKVLDPKKCDWGFNMIFIAGSDASFLNPTEGWLHNSDLGPGGSSRFSYQFTDLNLTANIPCGDDSSFSIKAGRQTTVLGPMGALPWQRWFDSSDYAWYNMEEGRYTGVSTNWIINKQLSWYNGFELGWGTFFDGIGHDVDYITQINYWLDKEAKKCKVWTTVLTGPTSQNSGKNTTVLELGTQINWNERWYQIIDTQMVWSKGPVDAPVPPGYNERAYDVYTYIGYHVNKCLDFQMRYEWYDDVDGRQYAGGFGKPHTDYIAVTWGVDYHPCKWIQIRPEIRYDHATHPNFGENFNHKNELTMAFETLFKF